MVKPPSPSPASFVLLIKPTGVPSDCGSSAVRVRPFVERELGLIAPATLTSLFAGEGTLASTPTSGQLLSAHRASSAAVRNIVKVVDDRVLVFDPPETNPSTVLQRQLLGPAYKKVKDIRFCFDKVFDQDASQKDVYEGAAKDLVSGVLNGFNSTVFAYGVRRVDPYSVDLVLSLNLRLPVVARLILSAARLRNPASFSYL